MIKTLIVEDNREFRTSLKALLYGNFPAMVIAEADNGNDAIRRFVLFRPDLVFLDINLPGGISGLTLLERWRGEQAPARIVMITAHDLPEYRDAAVRLGADSFLPKIQVTGAAIHALIDRFAPSPGGTSR
jgi:two-component system, response regulator YesN